VKVVCFLKRIGIGILIAPNSKAAMKITKLHNINFDTEVSILTASFSSSNELVVLTSVGNVERYSIQIYQIEN